MKQGPIKDPGRGNSLFSEIEDKRAILERKLANIHKKYVELKKVLVMKSSELEKYKVCIFFLLLERVLLRAWQVNIFLDFVMRHIISVIIIFRLKTLGFKHSLKRIPII